MTFQSGSVIWWCTGGVTCDGMEAPQVLKTACRSCTQPEAMHAPMLMWQTWQNLPNTLVLPCRVVGVSVVMWLIVLVCVLVSGPIGDSCAGISGDAACPLSISGLPKHGILMGAKLAGAL